MALDLRERRLLGVAGELAAAAVAALIALLAWGYIHDGVVSWTWVSRLSPWIGGFTALWFVAAAVSGRFTPTSVASRRTNLEVALLPAFVALGLYLATYFAAPRTLLPRLAALVFVGVATVLTWAWQTAWVRASAHPIFGRRVLVLGAGETGRLIAEELQRQASAGWRVIGFVDDDETKGRGVVLPRGEVPVLGASADLPELTERLGVREIVLGFRGRATPSALAALMTCQERGVGVVPGLEVFEALTGRIPVDHVGEDWYFVLPLRRGPGQVLYPLAKRVGDLLVGVVGLSICALLFPVVAPLIRLDSRGPVLYRQTRVGRDGRVFVMWKFRTMTTGAEAQGPLWAQVKDPRVTRVGRWLRRLRIDEMPQFWNVLKGAMSLVGPRPERPELEMGLDQAIRFYRLRHLAKPGLTGWATLHHGYADSVESARRRLEYDLYYIKHRSLGMDAQILLQTVLHVLTFRGR